MVHYERAERNLLSGERMFRTRRLRTILLCLLFCAVLCGVPTLLLVREYRQEQLNHALMAAIEKGKYETAISLLDAGAEGNSTEEYGYFGFPPTRRANLSDWLDKLRGKPRYAPKISALGLLLHVPTEPDEIPPRPDPPGYPRIVKALLDHGANPNDRTEYSLLWYDGTVLGNAMVLGYSQTVHLLVDAGANINSADGTRQNILRFYRASEMEHVIQRGADVNAQDTLGVTPLMYYSERDDVEAVQILLKSGAKVNVQDKKGWTALHYSVYPRLDSRSLYESLYDHVAYSRDGKAIPILLKHRADTSLKTEDGLTAMGLAKHHSDMRKIALLRQAGVKE
jgi:hypothetical protein